MRKELFVLNREYQSSKKFGAVVFIIDRNNQVYTQEEKELNESTGKSPGSYSVVCETGLPGEEWDRNVVRGIVEEIGISEDKLSKVLDSEMICWETGFMEGVWASVVIIKCKDSNLFMELAGRSGGIDGVSPIGFLPRKDFENLNLRQGVRNIINKFGDTIFNNGKTNFS